MSGRSHHSARLEHAGGTHLVEWVGGFGAPSGDPDAPPHELEAPPGLLGDPERRRAERDQARSNVYGGSLVALLLALGAPVALWIDRQLQVQRRRHVR